MTVLAFETAALRSGARPFNVEVVSRGGPDWLVPLGTLIAAVLGVVIGGLINRATLSSPEKDRAERESRLENDRAARELATQRRQALGAMRVLTSELDRVRNILVVEQRLYTTEHDDTPPLSGTRTIPSVREEDMHSIAMWVDDDTWRYVALVLHHSDNLARLRGALQAAWDAENRVDLPSFAEELGTVAKLIEETQQRLRSAMTAASSNATTSSAAAP